MPDEEYPASETIARAARMIEERLTGLEGQVHRLSNLVNELWLAYQREKRKP